MSDTTSTSTDPEVRDMESAPEMSEPGGKRARNELEAALHRVRERPVPLAPNLVTPNRPVLFDEKTCIRCDLCIEACPVDVLAPSPNEGGLPVIMFPDECWYCGCCEMHCPRYDEGAIRINFPLMQRGRWKRKDSGEHFRVGMKNPPPPNTRDPA